MSLELTPDLEAEIERRAAAAGNEFAQADFVLWQRWFQSANGSPADW